MPIFKYSKLVRDNIAEWHTNSGHTPAIKYLKGEELVAALIHKIREEVEEVSSAATRDELAEELADVSQVIQDLCIAAGLDQGTVEKVRIEKAAQKGTFSRGIYIEQVNIPDEKDEWSVYCRRSPHKYPEIHNKGQEGK